MNGAISPHFAVRLENLISDLSDSAFLKPLEIEFIKAWISDLKKVGYEFPSIQMKETL